MKKMRVALVALLALACIREFGVDVEPPPPLLVYDAAPITDVRLGDTLEIEAPRVEGGTAPYTLTYTSNDSYLHIVGENPLRVYASDGGHPTLTATAHDSGEQVASAKIEVRLLPQSPIEGRWYMMHTLGADTVELWADLMPGHPWCPRLSSTGNCVNPNCSTMSDGYPHHRPCPARSFNMGGQVKWQVGSRDSFWPDPFTRLPWPRNSFVAYLREPSVVLNIGVAGELGICERGSYATFRGNMSDDLQTVTGNLTYGCDHVAIGVPAPWNPSGKVTLHRQEIPR